MYPHVPRPKSTRPQSKKLQRIAQVLEGIIQSMFGFAMTGIRNPLPPPSPKHPELLALIIGEAAVIGDLAQRALTRQRPTY